MSPKDYSEDSENLYYSEQNKKKKKELKEKYGMTEFNGKEEAPPKVINDFLNYIDQYEEAYKHAEEKTIREIMKFPEFRKLEEIKKDELAVEIDKVLDKYAEYSIYIDVIEEDDVEEEDFYRFLTEELQEHQTYHMEVPGMNSNFIYEEFHPNQKLNIKDTTRYFTDGIRRNDKEQTILWVDKEVIELNCIKYNRDEFAEKLFKLFPDKIDDTQIIFNDINTDELNAKIDFIVNYNTEEKSRSKVYEMKIGFNRVDDENMEVRSIEITER